MTTRADLAKQFRSVDAGTFWKTFVIEAHSGGDAGPFLNEVFDKAAVLTTEDANVHEVRSGEVRFVVDHLDARFWSFHTADRVSLARPILKGAVERSRLLDWMWLPSQHLESVWPGNSPTWLRSDFRGRRLLPTGVAVQDLEVRLRGTAASAIVDLIRGQYREAISFDQVASNLVDRDFGVVQEAVNRQGKFVARGSSFEFHQEVIRGVVDRYRRFVDSVEQRFLRWDAQDGGGIGMRGSPIGIRFSRAIPDRDLFLDRLFSSGEPFRLWGVPVDTGSVAEVEAVDLHVGQPLRFDIGDDWLRVYLFESGCGNSIARLVTNLQHHFDGALSLADPELDATFKING